MPQFDFSQALPQILWLALIFGLLNLIVRAFLPRVQKVVETRGARIAADLREAEAARDAAEAATSGGSSALAEARARSLSVTGKARDEASAATSARLAIIDQDLAAKAEAATVNLGKARESVVSELDKVAGEATVDLVRRVSGLDIAVDEAAAAVKKVAA